MTDDEANKALATKWGEPLPVEEAASLEMALVHLDAAGWHVEAVKPQGLTIQDAGAILTAIERLVGLFGQLREMTKKGNG